MPRPKGSKNKKEVDATEIEETVSCETKCASRTHISHLSVDYSNEGLNNMARKVNEIINHINA